MTPEPAQPAEAWLNDPASLESGELAQPAESPEARARQLLEDHGCFDNGPSDWVRVDDVVAILAASTARPTERGTVEGPTKEWCLNMARLEGNQEIGAGMPDHPLRAPEATASTARPTERGAVEPTGALLICDQTGGRMWTRWPVDESTEQEAKSLYGDSGGYRTVPLYAALPATDQAADVERLIGEAKEFADYAQTDGFDPSDALDLIREFAALATQPATGRTMGGEVDVDAVARTVADRCQGNRKPGQSPTRYATIYQAARLGAIEARAALQNGGG